MTDRYIPNPYPDYDPASGNLLDESSGTIKQSASIQSSSRRLLAILEENMTTDRNSRRDDSVYTGIPGYAYFYYRLFRKTSDESYLQKAKDYSKASLKLRSSSARHRISFLCGDPGILSVTAVSYYFHGAIEDCLECINQILSLMPSVCDINSSNPDEILYGRSGYLYSLLFLRSELQQRPDLAINQIISNQHLRQVISAIIESGKRTSVNERKTRGNEIPPLYYYWHESVYIGAAHGFFGIIYMLLKCHQILTQEELQSLIRPTLEWLLTLRFPSGNTQSSIGSERDRLVHWCHGAPGTVATFCIAYHVYGDRRYLEAAELSSDVIWQRGLLMKGYGICHGIAGNGYAFLTLYRATRKTKFLYRAIRFAEFISGHGTDRGMRTPDAPYSLFEGLAGTVCFMFDLIKPLESSFPAYELPELSFDIK